MKQVPALTRYDNKRLTAGRSYARPDFMKEIGACKLPWLTESNTQSAVSEVEAPVG